MTRHELIARLTKDSIHDLMSRKCHAEGDCLIWHSTLDQFGHGLIDIRHTQRRAVVYAHRAAAHLHLDMPIVGKHFILQTCGRKACCALEHLQVFKNRSEMMRHFRGECNHLFARGSRAGRATIDEAEAAWIKQCIVDEVPRMTIAKHFRYRWKHEIAVRVVDDIKAERSWRHIPWPKRSWRETA